jgi:hypothetical protein
MCIKVIVSIFTIIVFCSEILFFTCVSYHVQQKNHVCKKFLCDLSTTGNVLKIAVCGSSKKFYSPQLCALHLLAFDSNIFQCAVYEGLWLLMCIESCDKVVQSMISQRVAGVITSMLCEQLTSSIL